MCNVYEINYRLPLCSGIVLKCDANIYFEIKVCVSHVIAFCVCAVVHMFFYNWST